MKAQRLVSKQLSLVPLSVIHCTQKYVDWMNDSEVIEYLESGGDYTIDKLYKFLKEQENKNIFFWAIHLNSDGKHIGNIKIDPIDEMSLSGEYGIMMGDRKEWGKGYAKEASLTVIDFCFKTLGLKQITLGVIKKNTNALELYKRIGFQIVDRNLTVKTGEEAESIRMVLKRSSGK